MSSKASKDTLEFVESVALIAMMMSLTAFSIDAVLPALPDIGNDLGVREENMNQLVIVLLFLGMSAGGQRPSIHK